MNHKPIKRFQIKVEFLDDSHMIRIKNQYENILTHQMRDKGYLRVLDIDTNFSVEFDGTTWMFLMTLYGIYVGRNQAWQHEAIMQGKLLPRTIRSSI